MRNRYILLFITLFLMLNILHADNYRIVSINTPDIKIGDDTFVKGSNAIFSDQAIIYWSSDHQVLRAINTNQQGYAPRTFTQSMFRQRNAKTIHGYLNSLGSNILRTQSGIGRAGSAVYFEEMPKSVTLNIKEKRLALVIGNSNYLNTNIYPNLKNASHDAEQVATALRARGFDVILTFDCSKFQLDSCLTYFIKKASKYDVALLYYAGHGLMYDKADYLIPIDAEIEYPEDVERECTRTSSIIRRLNYTSRLQNLIVLDACRSIRHRWVRSAYDHDEWTAPTTPYGTHVLYSTQTDEEAYDGNADLSPFAKNYIDAINVPGLNTNDVIQRVIDGVIESTNHKQFPTGIGTPNSNFYYYPNKSAKSSSTTSSTSESTKQLADSTINNATNSSISVSPGTNNHNGHEYVDLGLPSGLKWATCNIGANFPEEEGDKFAWGEITPRKRSFTWYQYIWGYSDEDLTKYCTDKKFGYKRFKDDLSVLLTEDDAAHMTWGGNWRMPSESEIWELYHRCSWLFIESGDGNGVYKVIGPNGNFIILPLSHDIYHNTPLYQDTILYSAYWSASVVLKAPGWAYTLQIYNPKSNFKERHPISSKFRCVGLSIRPVCSL